MTKLNPSLKYQLSIGTFIGFWLFSFALFIRPFDDGTINFKAWMLISVGFSFIAFLCYGLLAVIQKEIFAKVPKWNLGFEIFCLILFQILYLICTYIYYKSPLLKGGYNIIEFTQIIIIKTALISTPILILARIYVVKLIPAEDDEIIIRGENKLDVLRIKKSDLVCISNAQNYVEIFFTDDNQLKTKLIRSTLKKVHNDFDFLVQIHRSHLINPLHFKTWKNQDTISLTQIELPVSKNYKPNLMTL